MKVEKDITIYDLAHELNLSAATVSRALNHHPTINKNTRKRIIELAQKRGYRSNTFASNLRKQHTNTIGLILHELNSQFMVSVLSGIEKVTTEANYDLIIGHSSESSKKEAANALNFFNKRVDGLIASLAFDTENLDHFAPYKKRGIPVVFFDRVFEEAEGAKVIINNRKAGFEATRHLIMEGCTKIVHVTASLQRNVYSERFKGYQEALQAHHLRYLEKNLLITDLSEKDCIAAAKKILAMKPMPDGIFVTSDFSAAVIMRTLQDVGIRIPEDIAIVGFNNDTISTLIQPSLTTINYPGAEIGEIVAQNLIQHLQGKSDLSLTNTIIINSDLIIRASSSRKNTL